MTSDDSPRFFQALAAMALIFCDELAHARQKLYWEVFRDRVTIEEWEHACGEAIEKETFHKVPLPAVLLEYAQGHRRARQKQDTVRAEEERRGAEEEVRLLATPLPPGYVEAQLQALLDQVAQGVPIPAPPREQRAPEYRKPLEDCEYLDRKARLLRQAQKVQDEQKALIEGGEPLYEPHCD